MDSVKIMEAVDFIRQEAPLRPEVGVVLGSGLGILATEVENRKMISYSNIPHFPVSTVEGHEGHLVLGKLAGKQVVLMQGRFHFYEGKAGIP